MDDEIIHKYTRRQAIEDGVLVDLLQEGTKKLVREAGFTVPLAMTATAFAETVGPIYSAENKLEQGRALPAGQSIEGRLWDVLWMLRCAISRNKHTDHVHFQVYVRTGEREQDMKIVRLWSLIGLGDEGEPVITLMLENED